MLTDRKLSSSLLVALMDEAAPAGVAFAKFDGATLLIFRPLPTTGVTDPDATLPVAVTSFEVLVVSVAIAPTGLKGSLVTRSPMDSGSVPLTSSSTLTRL